MIALDGLPISQVVQGKQLRNSVVRGRTEKDEHEWNVERDYPHFAV